MAGSSILQADMTTVAGWIRQFWGWWTGELADLVPVRWRGRTGGTLLCHHGDPQRPWTLIDKGVEQGLAPLPTKRQARAPMALAPTDILVRTLALPAMSQGDLRQMVALDIDRLSPFPADKIVFDLAVTDRGGEDGRMTVQLGVLPLDRGHALLEEARALGHEPSRIGLIDADGRMRFDFLGALGGRPAGGATTARWWIAIALLFALNLGLLVWRDQQQVEAMRLAIDEAAPGSRTALALRQRIEGEQQRRAALDAERDRRDPLRVIDIASRAIPQGAWVQRLNWDGEILRLSGYRQASVDVAQALRDTPMLRDVTENEPEDAAGATEQATPFDISALVLSPAAAVKASADESAAPDENIAPAGPADGDSADINSADNGAQVTEVAP